MAGGPKLSLPLLTGLDTSSVPRCSREGTTQKHELGAISRRLWLIFFYLNIKTWQIVFFFLRNKRRNLFLLNILNMRETRQSPVKFLHWLILLVLPCFVICICWALTSSQIIQLYLSLLCGKALWCMISSFHVCTYRSLKLDFDELNRLNCLNLSVRQIFQPLTHSCGLLQNLREWSNIFNIWRIDLVILFQ